MQKLVKVLILKNLYIMEKRYVIKLYVEFLGGIYETEFTLDDREDRTPILFDREFMSRVNVMVNPDRKYVVTTKYSLD